MDPASLAAIVVGLVASHLQRLGGRIVGRVTDDVAEAAEARIERLYDTLKARLRPGSYEAGQLEGVAAKPGSRGRQQALESALAEYLVADPAWVWLHLRDRLIRLHGRVGAGSGLGGCVGVLGRGGSASRRRGRRCSKGRAA